MKLGFNGSTGTDIYIIEKTVHKENIGKHVRTVENISKAKVDLFNTSEVTN